MARKKVNGVAKAVWPTDCVVRRPLAALAASTRNARVHPDAQVEQLANSIREWGFTMPILVDERGEVIAGHGRLLAAEKLGLAEVPVMEAVGWTAKQIRAYRLADNQLALNAAWDIKLFAAELGELTDVAALVGFSAAELQNIMLDREYGPTDPNAEWEGMPEFSHLDKRAFRSVVFHFKTREDLNAFAAFIGRPLTEKTRFVWWPEIEIETYADKAYVDDEAQA